MSHSPWRRKQSTQSYTCFSWTLEGVRNSLCVVKGRRTQSFARSKWWIWPFILHFNYTDCPSCVTLLQTLLFQPGLHLQGHCCARGMTSDPEQFYSFPDQHLLKCMEKNRELANSSLSFLHFRFLFLSLQKWVEFFALGSSRQFGKTYTIENLLAYSSSSAALHGGGGTATTVKIQPTPDTGGGTPSPSTNGGGMPSKGK